MFPAETKKSKKSRKSTGADAATATDADAPEPVDVLVDNVIGFLEQATAYMRSVANQVFALLSGSVKESTMNLILSVSDRTTVWCGDWLIHYGPQQLERRDPAELVAEEEEELEGAEDSGEEEEEEDSSEDAEEDDDNEDEEEEEDLELRRKIEEALRINGVEAATGDSDDESDEDLMDDDQMLAIDEQLAAVFRARATERKTGKGRHRRLMILGRFTHSNSRCRCAARGNTLQEPCTRSHRDIPQEATDKPSDYPLDSSAGRSHRQHWSRREAAR